MDVQAATGLIEQVNEQLDPVALLERIGFATDRIQAVGGSVKAFCPIHKDTRFRSLLIDAKKKTFKCTNKACRGYEGGTLVDLYAAVREIEPLAAATELAHLFELDVDTSHLDQVASSLLDEAERAFVDHDHQRAEAAARQALQFRADLLDARLLLANILAAKGESAQACDEFIAVAEHYTNQGSYEDADRVLERASMDFPDNEDLLLLKVHSAELQGKVDRAESLLLELAARREASGRKIENAGVYEKLVSLFPDKSGYLEKLAEIYLERREFDRAVTTLNNLAFHYAAQGQHADIVRVVEKSAAIRRPEAGVQSIYVDALVALGEFEKARAATHDLILAYIESTMFFEAQQAARRWAEVEPESPEVHEWLGLIWQEQSNGPEAAREFREAALLASKRGELERAIELLGQARFNEPENVQLRWDLIDLLRQMGQKDQAFQELCALADYLFAIGDREGGERAVLQAIELRPLTATRLELAPLLAKNGCAESAARLYIEAAHECEETDDFSGAVACYESYLELRPDDRDAKVRYAELLWESDLVRLATQVTLEVLDAAGEGREALAQRLLPHVTEHLPEDTALLQRLLEIAIQTKATGPARQLLQALAPCWHESDAEAARRILAQMVELFPEDAEILAECARWHLQGGDTESFVATHVRIADLAEARGDYRTALAHLAVALEQDPQRLDLIKRRADLLARLDDPELARAAHRDYLQLVEKRGPSADLAAEYRGYLEKWPDDHEVRRALAATLEALGQADDARHEYDALLRHARRSADLPAQREILDKLIALDPANLTLKLEQADVLMAMGESAAAVGLYREVSERALESGALDTAAEAAERARALAPDNPELLQLGLRVAEARGDAEKLEAAGRALAELGNWEPLLAFYRQRVRALADEARLAEAQQIVGKWLQARPDEVEPVRVAAQLAEQAGQPDQAAALYQRLAQLHHSGGDTDRALEALARAESLAPADPKLKAALAEALLAAGRQDEGVEAMLRLARLHRENGRLAESLESLKRAHELRPADAALLRELADLTAEVSGFADALPAFRRLLALYRQGGETNEAAVLYERLLSALPDDAGLRQEYAEFLESTGNPVAAKQQFLVLARFYRDRKREPLRAIAFLGRATALAPDPGDAAIFEELAALYLESAQTDFAAGSLRDAARLYEDQGLLPRAAQVLKKVCELPSGGIEDWEKLGDLLGATGQTSEALAAWKRAYQLAEESSGATTELRAELCRKILSVEPANIEVAVGLIELLPPEQSARWALDWVAHHGLEVNPQAREAVLEAAKRAAPKNIEVRQALASLWRETGDTARLTSELIGLYEVVSGKGATKLRKEIIEQLRTLPRTPELSLKLASLMADTGDTEQAVSCYTQVAEELIDQGSWPTALEALETALALDPGALGAPLVAKLYRASQGDARARQLTQQAFDAALLARSRTRALVLGTVLLEFCSPDDAVEILERVNQKAGAAFLVAIATTHLEWLIEHDRSGDVEPLLQRVLDLAGTSPDAWYLAAQIYRKLGQAEKAAQASKQAARLFAQAGAVTEEESCYREVLEVFPDDIATLETLVSFYERERRKPDVIDLVKRLIELTGAKNDHVAAAKWINKFLQYDPGNLEYREKLVDHLIKAGQGEQAVEALIELVRMLRNLKFTDRAAADCERILVLDPGNEAALTTLIELAEESRDRDRATQYLLQLADAKVEAGDLPGALELVRSYVEKHPDAGKALDKLLALAEAARDERLIMFALRTIGYQRAKTGDFDGAIASFERLLELQPGNKEILKVLLDCCSAARQMNKAAEVAMRLFELECESGTPAGIREAAYTVLAFDEKRAPVRKKLAETLAQLGERDEAVRQWSLAAETFVASKSYPDAIACLQAITQYDPANVEAWRRLAELLALTGNVDAANDALVELAAALAQKGETQEACRVLDKVVEHGELDPALRERALEVYRRCGVKSEILPEIVWLAHYYLNRHNIAKAEELVREGLELDPEDLMLLECRVEVARSLGRSDEVLFRLRELAQKYIDLGDQGKAAAALSELVREDPTLVDVRLQLAQIYEEIDQPARAHEEYVEVVRRKLEQGDIEEAREIAERALAGPTATTELRARIAELFAAHRAFEIAGRYMMQCAQEAENRSQPDKAIQYLGRAVEYRPKWIEAYERLADLSLKINRPLEAIQALENLTDLLLEQKRLREATEVLKRRIQLTPREVEPRRQLVDLLEMLGERDARLQQLQELADLLISRGEIEEAVDVYRQLTQLEPDDPALLNRYLELFSQIGNELEVLDDYQRLADLYIKKGQFQEATRTFERILSIDRRQTDVREKFIQFLLGAGQRSRATAEMAKLADLYMAKGDYASATRWLANAHALNPADLNVLESLAEAYARAGNANAAAEHFYKLAAHCAEGDPWRAVSACRRVVDLVPDHRPTREIFSQLLMKVGERVEAAANALALAELYRGAGESELAEQQEKLAREYEPETIESLSAKLEKEKLDPATQYDYLVRLGDLYYQAGDVDRALEQYRRARQIDNSNPELIRKYVNALLQIAPESEAIADLIELASSYEGRGAALRALETYEQVLKIDARNQAAKAGRTRMRKITNTE
jgi:tetratricopeptide (TPR) repeat protein